MKADEQGNRSPRLKIAIWFWSVAVIGAVMVGCLAFYLTAEPHTNRGQRWLIKKYQFAKNKQATLTEIGEQLDQWNGGTCPPLFDNYLANQFGTTSSIAEQIAIVDFGIDRSIRGRPIFLLNLGHSKTNQWREKIVEMILSRISTKTNSPRQLAALGWIEAFRTGQHISKVGSSEIGQALGSGKITIDQLVDRYRDWFSLKLTWQEKVKLDPLEGMGLSWD